MSGFAIGLVNPKNKINVGAVVRAAGCFGAGMVAYTGKRVRQGQLAADTMKMAKRIPLLNPADLSDIIPHGYYPVAVDIVPGARCLSTFSHPRQAFYVFGPEDGTLLPDVLSWCPQKIVIPSLACLNLAAAVNVVLYDRIMKDILDGRTVSIGNRVDTAVHNGGLQ